MRRGWLEAVEIEVLGGASCISSCRQSSRAGHGLEAGERTGLESLASSQQRPSLESQDTECRSAEGTILTGGFSPGVLHILSGDRGSSGLSLGPSWTPDAQETTLITFLPCGHPERCCVQKHPNLYQQHPFYYDLWYPEKTNFHSQIAMPNGTRRLLSTYLLPYR